MISNKICKKWVDIVSKLDVQIIIPQHVVNFKGDKVKKFLEWFYNLQCGIDLIDNIYG